MKNAVLPVERRGDLSVEHHGSIVSLAYLFLDGREVASIKALPTGGLALVLCRPDGFGSLLRITQSDAVYVSKNGETIDKVPFDVFQKEFGRNMQAVYLNQGIYMDRELP